MNDDLTLRIRAAGNITVTPPPQGWVRASAGRRRRNRRWGGGVLITVIAALGTWTSASLLDVFGGPEESAAAQRLIGSGLLAAAPTAWTGWAEWAAAGPRDKRVGLVHAGINGLTIGIYAASWVASRRGRHKTGARLALGAAAVLSLGAYLGGHLAEARKVGTHHPAFS